MSERSPLSRESASDLDRKRIDRQVKDGTLLGTCDWGNCDREQAGWGWSNDDDEPEWLAICAQCSRGEFPPENTEPLIPDLFAPLPGAVGDV
jgi:hypothetical protein